MLYGLTMFRYFPLKNKNLEAIRFNPKGITEVSSYYINYIIISHG